MLGFSIVNLIVPEREFEVPSAFANQQLPWERAIAPALGFSSAVWTNLLDGVYHCPADLQPRHLSYGMNYYFELGPNDD